MSKLYRQIALQVWWKKTFTLNSKQPRFISVSGSSDGHCSTKPCQIQKQTQTNK